MDAEETFIRVQERFSHMFTPTFTIFLEYLYLFISISFFSILLVMHANYLHQPGCSTHLRGRVVGTESQLIHIKITNDRLWSHNDSEFNIIGPPHPQSEFIIHKIDVSGVNVDELTSLASKFWWNWIGFGARRGKLVFKFWKTHSELQHQAETSTASHNSRPVVEEAVHKEEPRNSFSHFLH